MKRTRQACSRNVPTYDKQFVCKPCDGTFLAAEFFFDELSDVYHSAIKKAEPFITYFQSEGPPSTLRKQISKNSSRPVERELSSTYSRLLQIGGFQIERIRAKSSNIFSNKYKNGNAFPNVYSFKLK